MQQSGLVDGVRRWLPRTGSLAAYLLAMVLVVVGILLRIPLELIASGQPLPPYLTVYPAIVIASFAGGIRVGFVAMTVSAVAAALLWAGPDVQGDFTAARLASAIAFLFTGAITVLTCGFARLLLDEVAASEDMRSRTARESVHRIKNLLAVIQSISRKIGAEATDVPDFRERLEARLKALAISQDMLLKRDGGDVPLDELVRATLGPFLPNPRLEVLGGPHVIFPKGAVTALSMALYELATNSAKYGALASPEGYVRLETLVRDGRCSLEWREIGLAHVAMSGSAGLGTTLIRTALSAIDDSAVLYDVSPQSVSCVFEWPTAN